MHYICKTGGLFAANTYLIIGENNHTLIIDPTDFKRMETELQDLHPVAILLTHGHFDHICALCDLLEHYDIPVYIHANDEEMLYDPIKNGLHLFYPHTPFRRPCGQIIPIRDGDQLNFEGFSNPIRVIHSPGHTKGCACYLFNKPDSNPTLFTGDVLFEGSIGRTDLYGGSAAEMQASLRELSKLSDDIVVCPGHGDATDIGTEKKLNPYLR